MAAAEPDSQSETPRRRLLPRRRRWRLLLLVFSLIGLAVIWAWMSREQIAENVIQSELDRMGLPATYEIVSIGPQQQRLRNFVVGDPERPDLTIEEIVVNLEYGLWGPAIGRTELIGPRLYGSYRDGVFSLGALDTVIFAESDEPPGLPPLDIAIRDGRALFQTDYGNVGVSLVGEGALDDGFAGKLAATAPGAGYEGCVATSATAYGDLTSDGGILSFDGPIRLREFSCAGASLEKADIGAEFALTRELDGVGGSLFSALEEVAFGEFSAVTAEGRLEFAVASDGLSLNHDLAIATLSSPYATLSETRLDGSLRAAADFARFDWDTRIKGEGMILDQGLSASIARAKSGASGTLMGPILEKLGQNLARATSSGSLVANLTLRRADDAMTLVMPEGRFESADGRPIIALSRVGWTSPSDGPDQLRGNFVTGGEGIPQINGRMEQGAGGPLVLRLAMAEYRAGQNRIAIPRMQVSQRAGGAFDFMGLVSAGGVLPGGSVAGLEVPIEGAWSAGGGLAIGQRCMPMQFAALELYDLALDARSITVCPSDGRAIVSYDNSLVIAAQTGALGLSGELAGSPAEMAASGAIFRYPGTFELSDLDVAIGAEDNAVHLAAANLEGGIGDVIGGSFSGGSAKLDVVPLDLGEMSGGWAYRDDALIVENGEFVLTERIDGRARFEPLIARGATLSLSGNDIAARARLLHPGTLRLVTQVDVDHDLGTGIGQARINVPGLALDESLTPVDLSYLAEGVIALAEGSVSGKGRIDWTADDITSSGTFGSDDLDLAAAFGPLRGVRGTVEFTDLINLTTAPAQVLEIDGLNPGIEVLDGRVIWSLTNGEVIDVTSARWPFMGGELILRPVTINYGEPGSQSYVFEIVGLDAATFVAQMELGNLGATGTFDGSVPMIFDEDGNGRIEGGLLISRPPGGNVSYIGELTYKDLGAIGDFAFQSLRSLDYKQMSVGLNGNLAGEIITNFQFDGVRQGEGASKNFVTRQLAKLPIRFKVNVRSESFFQLGTIARIYLDPAGIRDPRSLGLFRLENGQLVPNSQPPPETPGRREDQIDDESLIQTQESEELP